MNKETPKTPKKKNYLEKTLREQPTNNSKRSQKVHQPPPPPPPPQKGPPTLLLPPTSNDAVNGDVKEAIGGLSVGGLDGARDGFEVHKDCCVVSRQGAHVVVRNTPGE